MDAKAIIERLKTDKEFAANYTGLSGIDAALEQAKRDGYDVTRKDVTAVLGKLGGAEKKELGEDELAAVAGGADKPRCISCGGDAPFEGGRCIPCAKRAESRDKKG